MRAFGKAFNGHGNNATGAPILITAPTPMSLPVLNIDGDPRQLEISMSSTGGSTGVTRVMNAVENPPTSVLYTLHGSGGCIPIVAAQVTPAGIVQWIYLVHGHYPNLGIDLTANGATAANIYVAFLVYDRATGWDYARHNMGSYFEVLDPGDQIPNANAMLLYGPYTSLAITPAAYIGVLTDVPAPAQQAAQGGATNKCCFLTTAACEALNLPDDCDELTAMRWYRDHILLQTQRGRALIDDYYAIAPSLVARIDQRPQRLQIYRTAFARFIAPTARLIRQQRFAEAETLYTTMIDSLQNSLSRSARSIRRKKLLF